MYQFTCPLFVCINKSGQLLLCQVFDHVIFNGADVASSVTSSLTRYLSL